MKPSGSLLVVDDNREILSAVKLLLMPHFEQVRTLPSPNRLVTALREEPADVVLLDMNFTAGVNTGNEGLFWLHEIARLYPATRVVLFTAFADIDLAVRAMKDGAVDFVTKPWDNERLINALKNARKVAREARGKGKGKGSDSDSGASAQTRPAAMFWGTSSAMNRIREVVDKVAPTDANILITGENGTGKEMLAREIHRHSLRAGRPMVTVDMGAVTETLFESELFGHVRGAFTDARTDRAGKFEAAQGGTLFLDEIGNLPHHLQSKLLSALQSKRIVRVGGNAPIEVDIRLVSATNRDLFRSVERAEFREDLLYRLNTIHIDLPPLRNRRSDIPALAQHFVEHYAARYAKPVEGFDRTAIQALLDCPWPGNIRELQHTIEKAVIFCEGTEITPEALQLRSDTPAPAATATTLEEMERRMIREAVDRLGGNLSAVAAELGITRQTLYNKLKRYKL